MPHADRIRVTLVVLGDLGRSPRMQYHALALAEDLAEVVVIAYRESALPASLREHPHVSVRALPPPHAGRHRLPRPLFLLYSALRVAGQALRLSWTLLSGPAPDYVLVQNPPSLPTLPIALLAARLRGARLVVDWHNFGYSLLALRLGAQHVAVRAARLVEHAAGRRADAHLAVSEAMRGVLSAELGVADATVLRDRPAEGFAPTPDEHRGDLFTRLSGPLCLSPAEAATIAARGPGRPAVIVSSTSWTADEDLDLLLDALAEVDRVNAAGLSPPGSFPALLLIVTGDGPRRAAFEKRAAGLELSSARVATAWLEPDDYPLLLGAADLGVSCHRSSSGVDLPMKVLDMFGAGLPVCALDYGPCLRELVRHGENGLLFEDAGQLATHLLRLFEGFPSRTPLLDRLREGVRHESDERWSDAWREHARPVFAKAGTTDAR
jgi:beta-1,4-mannosyltransferase